MCIPLTTRTSFVIETLPNTTDMVRFESKKKRPEGRFGDQ